MKKLLLFLVSFFAVCVNAQEFEWVKTSGSNQSGEGAYSVKTDSQGNVYMAGNYRGTVSFNPGGADTATHTSVAYGDAYLEKFDANGNFLWVKVFNNNFEIEQPLLAIDSNDNVYFASSFENTIDLDPGTGQDLRTNTSDYENAYIIKLNSSGEYVWGKTFENNNTSMFVKLLSLCIDKQGNVLLGGHFQSTVDFDFSSNTQNITVNFPAGFILKIDSDGNYIWAKPFTYSTYGSAYVISLAVDSQNNIVAAGAFSANVDFDPGEGVALYTSPGNNNTDIFFVKLNSDGEYLWSKRPVGYGEGNIYLTGINDRITSLVIDKGDNIYFAGYYALYINFNPGTAEFEFGQNNGCDTCYYDFKNTIGKIDSSGNMVWVKVMEGGNNHTLVGNGPGVGVGNVLTMNSNGRLFFGMSFNGNFDYTIEGTPGSLADVSYGMAFMEVRPADGALLSVKHLPNSFMSSMGGINAHGNDVYVCGKYYESLTFSDSVSITSNAQSDDPFIAKYHYESDLGVTQHLYAGPVVYPNPAKNIVYIDSKSATISRVILIDVSGKVLKDQNIYYSGLTEFSLQGVATGSYFMQVYFDKGVVVNKILVE